MTNPEKVAKGMQDKPILLSTEKPIAKGAEHWIFRHPSNSERLLKVMIDDRVAKGILEGFLLPLHRASRARSLRLELAYWSDLMSRADGIPPIPRYFGMIETDLGSAHVVERISLPGRVIGPTLRQVSNRGRLGPRRIELLNQCVTAVRDFGIPARDFTPRNLVLGDRGRGPEFVLVDGFGDDGLFQMRRMSRWFRERQTDVACAQIAELLGLNWDPSSRLFAQR